MSVYTNDQEKCEVALQGLYHVDDPEVGLNIVDLGLVYQIDFDEDAKKLEIIMTLTTQFCPMGDAITGDTTNSLEESFPGWEINLELTFDPPWDYSMISPEGKEFLGY
ncbi:MAG: metal-sulfur cluster assembly factor [Weeksellaceae bacterium]|jgi:metal-sulfur cluster biosynthetic enzyme|nr:metal-sulfur cluster assembly factor [Weeksellaceae bacterium]MDX9704391.1 metal-sulfur cluster assembly factor [Weeksellaceae bacterium]